MRTNTLPRQPTLRPTPNCGQRAQQRHSAHKVPTPQVSSAASLPALHRRPLHLRPHHTDDEQKEPDADHCDGDRLSLARNPHDCPLTRRMTAIPGITTVSIRSLISRRRVLVTLLLTSRACAICFVVAGPCAANHVSTSRPLNTCGLPILTASDSGPLSASRAMNCMGVMLAS